MMGDPTSNEESSMTDTKLPVGTRVEIDEQAPFGAGKGVIVDYGVAYAYRVHRDDDRSGHPRFPWVAYSAREVRQA